MPCHGRADLRVGRLVASVAQGRRGSLRVAAWLLAPACLRAVAGGVRSEFSCHITAWVSDSVRTSEPAAGAPLPFHPACAGVAPVAGASDSASQHRRCARLRLLPAAIPAATRRHRVCPPSRPQRAAPCASIARPKLKKAHACVPGSARAPPRWARLTAARSRAARARAARASGAP